MSILREIASKVFLRMEDKMRVISGIDTAGQPQYAGMTAPVAATSTLTSDNTIMATGSTVTIGGLVYTYRTSLTASTTANEVLINGSVDAGLLNLIRAINRSGTPGTDYGSDTVANADASSATSVTSHTFLVTAKTAGAIGNLVATSASSSPNSHITWTSTVLTGGTNSKQQVDAAITATIDSTAKATAAAPSYVEGSDNSQSLDLTGRTRTVQIGSTTLTTTQVTSGTVATLVVARPTRVSVLIRNSGTSTDEVAVGEATVSTVHGTRLKAGESAPFTFVGLIQVLAITGTPIVTAADEYN